MAQYQFSFYTMSIFTKYISVMNRLNKAYIKQDSDYFSENTLAVLNFSTGRSVLEINEKWIFVPVKFTCMNPETWKKYFQGFGKTETDRFAYKKIEKIVISPNKKYAKVYFSKTIIFPFIRQKQKIVEKVIFQILDENGKRIAKPVFIMDLDLKKETPSPQIVCLMDNYFILTSELYPFSYFSVSKSPEKVLKITKENLDKYYSTERLFTEEEPLEFPGSEYTRT